MIFRYKYSSPYHHRSYLLYRHPRNVDPFFARCGAGGTICGPKKSLGYALARTGILTYSMKIVFPKLTWIRCFGKKRISFRTLLFGAFFFAMHVKKKKGFITYSDAGSTADGTEILHHLGFTKPCK